MRDPHRQREKQRHRQREKQAPRREPHVGLDPTSPESRHRPKVAPNHWATRTACTYHFHCSLFLFFFFKIYLFMIDIEREREGQKHRQREKQALHREPHVGLIPEPWNHALSLRHTLNHWATEVSVFLISYFDDVLHLIFCLSKFKSIGSSVVKFPYVFCLHF